MWRGTAICKGPIWCRHIYLVKLRTMSAPPTGHARLWEPTTATWARWKLMLSVPILAILVPTNFLALLTGTLALSWRRSPPVTVTVAALYVGWVGATDGWKNRAGQVGPEWLVSARRAATIRRRRRRPHVDAPGPILTPNHPPTLPPTPSRRRACARC